MATTTTTSNTQRSRTLHKPNASTEEYERYPSFTTTLALLGGSAVTFSAVQWLAARAFERYSETYRSLSVVDRRPWLLYAGSLVHAVAISAVSFSGIANHYLNDIANTPTATPTRGGGGGSSNGADPSADPSDDPSPLDTIARSTHPKVLALEARNRAVLAMMAGYFVSDFIGSRHEWLVAPSNVIHHVSATAIVLAGSQCRLPLVQYMPHVTVIEFSTIFLNLAWFCKQTGNTKGFATMSRLFALAFFVTRVCWLPWVVLFLRRTQLPCLRTLGIGRYGLYSVTLLQFWWFYRIVRVMLNKEKV